MTETKKLQRKLSGVPTGSSVPPAVPRDESALENAAVVCYRSTGLGLWGSLLRFCGMPLEKIALFMNSSQVSGSGASQMAQAVRLTFEGGILTPFKVVGRASMIAWFFQYSAMGLVFQFVDISLSSLLGVKRVKYGAELMEAPKRDGSVTSPLEFIKSAGKTMAAPVLSGSIESMIANRAEVQRFFGLKRFAEVETALGANQIARAAGPAFTANAARNTVMSSTSFVITPLLYHHFYPQDMKNQKSLFWFGLGMNIFAGNVVAITLQALWGRTLDRLAAEGTVDYAAVIRDGFKKEGGLSFPHAPEVVFSRANERASAGHAAVVL
eukprot:CAMPEP_0119339448 /NCGR_PEP_ID=MMETSP1333-20130426/98266_1 /TAXON_ID=418940 /ORGANISM="Scyphosphaera apsteinii, Strain RCC1455" /LENGTH=324 /DNA_ID=CAMNT_0007350963 /DNA_START=35 /DNA_END=1008 /DNA_ORIENTATION=-